MKKELKLMIAVNGMIILFLLYVVSDLLSLLNDDGTSDMISSSEMNSTDVSSQLIPKIIHQTYKNESIPEIWQGPQKSCIDLHPDYQYMFWSDQSSRDFIAEHYSWFLPTFDSYPYPIQRADAIRYFILSYYGGIYIDLDNGCRRRLDPLLNVPAWVRKTVPTGVSNDIMGSVPNHPFFKRVVDNLQRYNHNWLVSYITIMYSTGPLFVSVIWKQYKRTREAYQNPMARLRVVMTPTAQTSPEDRANYFFYTARGSSWHLGDAKFIFSMGRHWVLFTILGTCLVLGFLYLQYKLYQRLARWGGIRRYFTRSRKSGGRYQQIRPAVEMTEPEVV